MVRENDNYALWFPVTLPGVGDVGDSEQSVTIALYVRLPAEIINYRRRDNLEKTIII